MKVEIEAKLKAIEEQKVWDSYDLGESMIPTGGKEWIVQDLVTKLSTITLDDLDIKKNYF